MTLPFHKTDYILQLSQPAPMRVTPCGYLNVVSCG